MRTCVILFFGLLFYMGAFGQSITASGDITFCAGGSVILSVSPITNISTYQWINGNADIQGQTVVNLTVTSTGIYRVRLKRIVGNDTTIGPIKVTVNQKPPVRVNSPSICSGQSATLTASGADNYTWSPTSNLSSSTGQVVTTSTPITTTYLVTGTDSSTGCFDTDTATVTVNTYPTANFSFSPANECSSVPVFFTNSSVNGATYAWNFDDPNSGSRNTSSVQNPAHNFIGMPGGNTQPFNVTLTTTSSAGCSSSKSLMVTTKQSPDRTLGGTGQITYNGQNYFKTCGSSNGDFTFTNQSLTANSSYQIIWGDSSPDFISNTFVSTTHSYSVGSHPIYFIVTGSNNGCTDTAKYFAFVGTNPAVGLNNPGNTLACSGESLTFPISGTSTNAPGTLYTITFNDGTAPIYYTHPGVPASITHVFNNTSCGTTSSNGTNTYFNSFSANIVAENPCASSAATVVPIYISKKPKATFSITPKDTICVNTQVNFTNTSDNNYVDNGNCLNGHSVWSVSPATGWSINNGILGNDFGSNDPSVWLNSSSILSLNFSVPGTYTVKIKAGNTIYCGIDSIIRTICVAAPPIPSFNLNDSIGCAPFTVTTANTTTSLNSCSPPTYQWKVIYSPSYCGTSSSWSFTNSSSETSVSPSFLFNNPGTYSIKLIVFSACDTFSASKTITVKDKLAATIISPVSTCINQPISPLPSFNCFTGTATYDWSFPGGSPATSTDSMPVNISYNVAGDYNISLNITNACGTTAVTKPITINTVTPADAGAAQNKCGNTITMAANTPTIGTGTWTKISGSDNYNIIAPQSPITTITGLAPGTYIFRWTITNQTCTSIADVSITISAGASAADAGADQNLCLSTSTTLNGNNPAIGTGTWTQVSGPNTSIIATPANTSTSVSGLIPGTYIFRWTINFSNCTPTTDDVQVMVYDNPSPSNAGPDQVICSAGTSLAGNTPSTGKGTWSQVGNLPNVAVITSTTDPLTGISGLIPGLYKFKWTITNGPCIISEDTVQITVTEVATTPNAGADINTCIGSAINLSGNTAIVGSGVWTKISGPSGAVITDSTLSNTSITGLTPGAYIFRWTITNDNCPPGSDDVQVTVYDNPSAANAGADQTICAATTTLAAGSPLVGNGNWSQVGNLPNLATITNPGSSSANLSGLIPGVYKFEWAITSGPCVITRDTVQINVTQVATTANAGAGIRACNVSTVNLSGNTAVVGSGVWSQVSGNPAVIANSTLPNSSVTGLTPGTYVFRWTITNGNCPPTSDDVEVIIDENVTVANAGADQNKCGVSVTMGGNTPVIGIGSWSQFSGAGGALIVDPASPNTTITDLVPGTYVFTWTITNGSCKSSSSVTISIFSGASAAIAGPDQELCLNTTTTLNATSPLVGSGLWTQLSGPDTASIANASANTTAINGLIPGVYTFQWTVNYSNCTPNTDDVQVTVYNNPSDANAGIDQTICASSTTFAAAAPIIGDRIWSQISGPNAAIINDASSPVSTVSSLTPGIYKFKWTITNGVCLAKQDTVEINVSAIATTSNAGADQTYCNQSSVNLSANIPQTGVGLWSIVSGPNIPVIQDSASDNTLVNGLMPGNYIFRWTITNGVCPPSTDDVNILILDSLQNVITAPADTICAGQGITINGVTSLGGTGTYSYQWQQSLDGNNWTDINGEINPNFSGLLNITTYFRRNVFSLPCEKFSNVIKITVQPGIANNLISKNDSICINTMAPVINGVTPTGGDGIYSYQWQKSIDGLVWNSIPGETALNLAPGVLIQTTQFRRLAGTLLCSGAQSSISNIIVIVVNPDSKAEFTANPLISCTPFLLGTAINVTAHPDRNLLYSWFADGNLFGSNTTGIFPGYSISNPGDTVIIKLVTTSQFGCKPDSTEQQFITVTTSIAGFTKDKTGGCGPLDVTFNNTSSIIDNIRFNWNFGNGITSTLAQPGTITFTQSPFFNDTTYQVTLKAFNGCDTTIWRDSVKISSNPKARFGVDTTAGCSPFSVQVTNNSLGGPNTYYWDFGNGHKDTTFTNGSFSYTYNIGNAVDTFPIRLIAVNECSTDTQVIRVRIAPNIIMPAVNINANDLFGCATHIVAFNNASTGATKFIWNYGDNTSADTTNNNQPTVVHPFAIPGIFNVSIRMTNGCSDTTVFRQVTIYPKPKADFNTSAPVYCLGDTISVIDRSLNASNYSWFWGDGQSSSGFNPTHLYTAAGDYTILLRAEKTNSSGIVCQDTLVQNIRVLVKPDVRVQSNITNINCTPFVLNATAPGIINEAVTWYISDTAVSTTDIIKSGITTQYTFTRAGTFTVKMVAQNASGCKDSTLLAFTVRGTPTANFTPLNISVCNTDTTVSYLNTTTFNGNGPISYTWLTDGLTQSTNGNLVHHYAAPVNAILPVTFITQLIATNSVGCSDTATGMLQMKPRARAQFSINNPNTCVPFDLSLANTSQYSTSYKWLLNGVTVDTSVNPVIPITKSLTSYTITLITDNVYGCGPDTFSVNFISRIKPKAAFTLNDTLGCTGALNIVTTNQTSNANTYQWDWGDNSANSFFTSPTHLYTVPGKYLITLVASDGVCKDTTGKLVNVAKDPVVDFSADDTLTCDTARIHFTNLTKNADTYLWSFSDGTFSRDIDPIKTFAPGPLHYTVKLVAFNNAGCKDSAIKANLIFAIAPPVSDFLISPSPVITVPDYTFTFNNLALNRNTYTYQWNLDDGSFATTRDVTHKYADTGSYTVTLIVLDNSTGCPDTTIKVAAINGYPGFLYVPNAFYPNSLRNEFRTFKPLGKGLSEYQLQIFDSWGKLLFETRELDAAGSPLMGWDGTNKGMPMPQDAYAWRITARFKSGKLWDGMSYGNKIDGKPGNTFGTVTLFR